MIDNVSGNLFDIQHVSSVDGPGLRTTVFFKGCNLRCAWCHNPESQSAPPELAVFRDRCKGCGICMQVCAANLQNCRLCGECARLCPNEARILYGKRMTTGEVMREITSDVRFYEASGGGVTFSGGECLLQPDFLFALLDACTKAGISTAVDTAGNVPWQTMEAAAERASLFLYDVKCIDESVHKQYTGVSNLRILDNLGKLLERKKRVWVRIPIIPGVNDSEKEMLAIRQFFERHGRPEQIELLPYHRMGESKYAALGLPCRKFDVPDAEKMSTLRAVVGC